VLSAAVIVFAFWYAHRHRAAVYHRRRWHHANCHAAPTRLHRVRLVARWVLTARIRIHITLSTTARTV
jgi:hypothetical protein